MTEYEDRDGHGGGLRGKYDATAACLRANACGGRKDATRSQLRRCLKKRNNSKSKKKCAPLHFSCTTTTRRIHSTRRGQEGCKSHNFSQRVNSHSIVVFLWLCGHSLSIVVFVHVEKLLGDNMWASVCLSLSPSPSPSVSVCLSVCLSLSVSVCLSLSLTRRSHGVVQSLCPVAERIVAAVYLASPTLRSFRHSCSDRPPSLPAALVIALLYPASLRRSASSPGPNRPLSCMAMPVTSTPPFVFANLFSFVFSACVELRHRRP